MLCPNCAAISPEGQIFCGKCGSRLTDTLGSVSDRVAKVERELSSSRNAITQHNLETETVENIMGRIQKWTTRFLYFAGIPLAIALFALAVMFGKGTFDLHRIAADAKESVGTLLGQARTQALDAEKVANDALATSKQVDADIKGTQAQVSKLKTEVESRSAEVQRLGDQINAARQKVDDLQKTVGAQSQQVQILTQQVHTAQTATNVADVQAVYPVFGTHMARSQAGWINPKQKTPEMVWIDINLALTATPSVSDVKVAEGITALSNRKYTIMMGPIYTYAVTARSNQAIGMGLDPNNCMYWVAPPAQVPCIIYFRENLKDSATEVRNLLKSVQEVPDAQLFYVDPKKLDAQRQELLELSAVDIVVILGKQ